MLRLAIRFFHTLPAAVRMIVILLLTLVAAGEIAVRLETVAIPAARASDYRKWVRTTLGWETVDNLRVLPTSHVTLHPGTVAAGQFCGSLRALLACSRTGE